MPDASIFSYEYRRASTLSDVLNRALLMLKKQARGIAVEEDEASQRQLTATAAIVMSSLADYLVAPADVLQPEQALVTLPAEFIDRIRTDHGGDLAYFVEDLRSASSALASNAMDDRALRTLEAVASAADVEAS